jgi:hypothetical protein
MNKNTKLLTQKQFTKKGVKLPEQVTKRAIKKVLTLGAVCYLELSLGYTLGTTIELRLRTVRWSRSHLPQLYKTHFISTPYTSVIFFNHPKHKKIEMQKLEKHLRSIHKYNKL